MPKEGLSLDLKSPMQKEVTLKFKPMHVLIVLGILLVLVGIFFAGRWSVSPICAAALDDSQESQEVLNTTSVQDQEPEVLEQEAQEQQIEDDSSAQEEQESNEAPQEQEVAAPAQQELITEYENVAIQIDSVGYEDKGSWGKINDVMVTVTNTENGKIVPNSIELTLKGYQGIVQTGSLSTEIMQLGAQETKQGKGFLTKTFNYADSTLNEANVDVGSVPITVTLKDANGKVIATTTKAVSLE